MNVLSTRDASEILGVSVSRVQKLILAGRLPAQKIGRDYVIRSVDLKLVEDRKVGRPKNFEGDTSPKSKGSKASKKSAN